MIKKCEEHTKGKTCFQVIAEGLCQKEECRLFKKVLNILPKFKKMYEAQAKGIILHTVWRFDERQMKQIERSKRKAEKWLKEFYPKIIENLRECGIA